MAVKVLISVGLLFAALTVLTVWKAARHETHAEAEYPAEGIMLDVDGVPIHAVVMGEGPDVVLIHGSSGNARDMTFSLAPILAENYRVIAFDRPGLGYSGRFNSGGESISDQAAILQKAAVQLGADRPIVLGQSYGGSVALAWAVHHPENISALVPVAAASHPWDDPLDLFNTVASHPVGSALVLPLVTAYVPDSFVSNALDEVFAPQTAPQGYAEHFGPGLTLRRHSMHSNALQRASLQDEIVALQPFYSGIGVPTEIVHGTADVTVGLDRHSGKLVQEIPEANLVRLEGIGHMPQVVAAEEVAAAVDRAAARAGLR
ncbi:alpha/beta fold hydrolase [Ruegeria sediminis]|uniref:alpha/beta fold hydrolase n=1 Tax=Ruegeria sediminis TaxID=2583820 RepID=UPI001FE31366|nr:alpha/beta hydrolase [Ruegeria sediminis]